MSSGLGGARIILCAFDSHDHFNKELHYLQRAMSECNIYSTTHPKAKRRSPEKNGVILGHCDWKRKKAFHSKTTGSAGASLRSRES